MPHLLTSSTANHSTLLAISFPSAFPTRSTDVALEPSVRTIQVLGGEGGATKWGRVEKLASGLGVAGVDSNLIALAHSTSHLSLISLPSGPPPIPSTDEPVEGELPPPVEADPTASIVHTYKTSTIKAGNTHISLDFLPSNHLFHTTASGFANLHSIPSSSSSSLPPPQKLRLPANITSVRPSADGKTFAYAGKEVDVSLWDVERGFAAASSSSSNEKSEAGDKKRKLGQKGGKDALMEGEIWRAKNIPNDHLCLRPAISHTCLTFLPSVSPHLLATGTSSGHLRTYDPRTSARKPTSNHLISSKGGGPISAIQASLTTNEIYFAEADSGKIGLVDGRTGRVLYSLTDSTSTGRFLLPLSLEEKVLISLAKDSTFSVHRTTGMPENVKDTPHRGITAARVGGCEGGIVRGWEGDVAIKRKEWEIRKEREGEEEETVWEGMGRVVGEDGEEEKSESEGEGIEGMEEGVVVTIQDDAENGSDDEEEDDSEEEEEEKVVVVKKKQGGKGGAAKKARR